jgi:dipeptidyl aminopeptidase/acylaminoacyl peptidase
MPVALFLAANALPIQSTALQEIAAPKPPISITDYRAMVGISSPQFSPSGRSVAFIQSKANFRTDRRTTVLEVVNLATRTTRALTDGAKTISSPRWSPSGDRIAYIQADRKGTDQLFVSRLESAPVARLPSVTTAPAPRASGPTQVTHAQAGVQQFAWSPRGDLIAYVTPDDSGGNPAIDLFDLNDVGYLTDRKPVPSHIWLVSSGGGRAKRLTNGPWSVLETAAPFIGGPSDPSWSMDGKWITFAQQANPYNSDSDLSTVAAVDVATGEVKPLSGRTSYEYMPAFCPRANVIAYLLPHGPTPLSVMDVGIASPTGGAYDLTGRLDRDVTAFAWAGRDLVIEANEGILTRLWRHRRDGKDEPLEVGALSAGDFAAASDGAVAFVGSTGTKARELYYLPAAGGAPVVLTHYNRAFDRFAYGKVSGVKWTSADGETSDGVLTYPVDYQSGTRAPLVVWVHGGPEESVQAQFDGFEGDLLRQTLAGEGYAVFQPNYRGSDNLGNHHEHAIFKDPGEGPAKDILAGIDRLVQAGLVDPERITIAGHSYGGLMTAWLISHDHRWRCAIVADGAVDWRATYDYSTDGNLAWARDSLGGTPADPASADLYRTGSPITYADQITTPTFIISGTADQTVPATESYELYHALKDRQVPVRFVAVPGAHHTPDSPNQYERFYALMEAWIRKWNPPRPE